MIHTTEALAVRISPYSRTSHVVTWLSADCGRLTTIIKGAQRPKSPFLGQYDLFYTCELVFYTRDRGGLFVAKECAPLKPRQRLRSDWRAAAVASYLCDLLRRCATEGGAQNRIYGLASRVLDILDRDRPNAQLLLWAELQALRELGLSPQLECCAACGRSPRGTARFSPAIGGLLCAGCIGRDRRGARLAAPDTVAMLRLWQGACLAQTASNTRGTPTQLAQASELLGAFLEYHLDISLRARYIALDVLAA